MYMQLKVENAEYSELHVYAMYMCVCLHVRVCVKCKCTSILLCKYICTYCSLAAGAYPGGVLRVLQHPPCQKSQIYDKNKFQV